MARGPVGGTRDTRAGFAGTPTGRMRVALDGSSEACVSCAASDILAYTSPPRLGDEEAKSTAI